ncbi:MAG: CBS domain-containing protein [Alphaproteobacteria bacterium]|nr:CBS domain-containing protein [Alphaproteobacteria bacterium]
MTNRRVSDIVKDQRPLIFAPTSTVEQACLSMLERPCGAVLVADEARQLLGIFTGRDAVGRVLAMRRDASKTKLADVMTRDPTTLQPGSTAIEALRLMQDCGIRHLPIVEDGKVTGIVSQGDFRGLEKARLDEETGLFERIY